MAELSSESEAGNAPVRRHRPVLWAAPAVGLMFLLVAVLGFVPGVTSNLDQLDFAGHESGALLLGIFQVSVLHNVVHLAFGVAGFAVMRFPGAAIGYFIIGGVSYLLLWMYGLLIDHGSAANFIPVNSADNWLHLGLGLGMLVLAWWSAAAALSPEADER